MVLREPDQMSPPFPLEMPHPVNGSTAAPRQVLYVDQSHLFGGAEQCLLETMRHLDRARYEPHVLFNCPLPHQKRYRGANAVMHHRATGKRCWMGSLRWSHPLPGSDRLSRWIFAVRLRQTVRRIRPAFLHINLYDPRLNVSDLKAAGRDGVQRIVHVRGLDWQRPGSRALFENCEVAICTSRAVRDGFLKYGPPEKFVVIHDPIDVAYFAKAPDQMLARSRLHFDSRDMVLASVAYLHSRKGHEFAIRALPLIQRELPQARLAIVGSEQGAREEKNRLEAVARDLGVAESVRFTGEVPDTRLAYSAADLVLSLSVDGEAFGRVPLEAALAGRVTIGVDMGAFPELIRHGREGYAVPPKAPEATARLCVKLLRNPRQRQVVAEAAATRVAEEFNESKYIRRLMELYDLLCAGGWGES